MFELKQFKFIKYLKILIKYFVKNIYIYVASRPLPVVRAFVEIGKSKHMQRKSC